MNMLDSYVYNVNLDWTHDRSGILGAETLPPIYYSAPPEFSGEAGKWTPEHMLVGSVASCFVSTFLAVAEHYKLEVFGLRMGAFARLEKLPGEGYRFTEITLFPEIRVAADAVETAECWQIALDNRTGPSVLALTRHRHDLDARAHAAHFAELDRQRGVRDGGIEPRRHGAQVAPVIGAKLRVDHAQIGAFAGAIRAPVDDARVDGVRVERLAHIFPFLVRFRRACVAITAGTSLLFTSERRSFSWRKFMNFTEKPTGHLGFITNASLTE